MRCAEAERWISMRVDAEPITRSVCEGLEAHLADCPCCFRALKAEVVRARALDSVLAAPGCVPPGLAGDIAQAALAGIQAGGSGSAMSWMPPLRIYRLAPVAVALAAAAGLCLYFAIPRDGHVEAAGRYVLEQSSQAQDVVPSQEGAPLGRDVSTTHWIYVIPTTGNDQGPAGQVKLDVERVDTRYIKLVNWNYH